MRAVVFPEREETECSERSYFQPQQGEGDSRPVRPPSGLGGPRKPTGAALLVTPFPAGRRPAGAPSSGEGAEAAGNPSPSGRRSRFLGR
ncbi:protein of unknown function [Methylacidimicrobium sp. AP8]|nr:protein of unknown function [Methylacidimicrobium sp. AP8]